MQESYVVCGGNNPSDPLQHYTVLPKVLCTGGLWHLGTLDFSLTIYTKLGENRGKLFSVYFTNHIQQQGLSLQGNSWVNVNKIMTWLCDHKLSMEFPKKMQAWHFHIYAVFSAHKDIMMNYRKTKFSFSFTSLDKTTGTIVVPFHQLLLSDSFKLKFFGIFNRGQTEIGFFLISLQWNWRY